MIAPGRRIWRVEGIGPGAVVTDEYWRDVDDSANSTTATWQGSAVGSFTGRVSGHAACATTLSFQLYHGAAGGGHAEGGGPFDVPVTVTATQQ